MYNGMVICRECGKLYFTWKKLWRHLIGKHNYEIPLDNANESVVE